MPHASCMLLPIAVALESREVHSLGSQLPCNSTHVHVLSRDRNLNRRRHAAGFSYQDVERLPQSLPELPISNLPVEQYPALVKVLWVPHACSAAVQYTLAQQCNTCMPVTRQRCAQHHQPSTVNLSEAASSAHAPERAPSTSVSRHTGTTQHAACWAVCQVAYCQQQWQPCDLGMCHIDGLSQNILELSRPRQLNAPVTYMAEHALERPAMHSQCQLMCRRSPSHVTGLTQADRPRNNQSMRASRPKPTRLPRHVSYTKGVVDVTE
jgi:hypothetical protein